jgi:hypothetical protein
MPGERSLLPRALSPGSSRVTGKEPIQDVLHRPLTKVVQESARCLELRRLNLWPALPTVEGMEISVMAVRHIGEIYFVERVKTVRAPLEGQPRAADPSWFSREGTVVAIINVGGGNSSTGRAPDCGSDGCGFDSRFPPQKTFATLDARALPCGNHPAHWALPLKMPYLEQPMNPFRKIRAGLGFFQAGQNPLPPLVLPQSCVGHNHLGGVMTLKPPRTCRV